MNETGCGLLFIAFIIGGVIAFIRRSRYLGIIILALALAFTGLNIYKMEKWSATFERIKVGDSAQRVRDMMGYPPSITDGTISVYGDRKAGSEITGGVVEEYWYTAFFAPEKWSVAFDSNQNVTSKFHYSSY